MPVRRDPDFADPDEAVRHLKKALATVDAPLPSLKVDLPSSYWTFAPPLLDLGRCTIDTAYRIADGLLRSSTRSADGDRDGDGADGIPQPSRPAGDARQ